MKIVLCTGGFDPLHSGHIAYFEAAKKLGQLIAAHKMTLVYGGAKVGLMGCVAKEVKTNGGKVIGVLPEMLKILGLGSAFFIASILLFRRSISVSK